MLLGPLEHQRRAKLLQKRAEGITSLPEKQKWLMRAGFHQAMARAQAINPDLLPKPESKASLNSSFPASSEFTTAPSMTTPPVYQGMLTPPPIFGSTSQMWEQFLEHLRSLPPRGLEAEIESAERMLQLKRRRDAARI